MGLACFGYPSARPDRTSGPCGHASAPPPLEYAEMPTMPFLSKRSPCRFRNRCNFCIWEELTFCWTVCISRQRQHSRLYLEGGYGVIAAEYFHACDSSCEKLMSCNHGCNTCMQGAVTTTRALRKRRDSCISQASWHFKSESAGIEKPASTSICTCHPSWFQATASTTMTLFPDLQLPCVYDEHPAAGKEGKI